MVSKQLKHAFEESMPEQFRIQDQEAHQEAPPSVEELEERIDRSSQELFQRQRLFRPLYPWVFVYVLPREQKVGSIILPEHEQNKTVHEGIVLATWRATRKYATAKSFYDDECLISEVHPGEHVLFPHWSGVPVSGYDTGKYRCVKEIGEGCIQGVIEYNDWQNLDIDLKNILLSNGSEWPDEELNALSSAIHDKFVLIDRNASSVTMSGIGQS